VSATRDKIVTLGFDVNVKSGSRLLKSAPVQKVIEDLGLDVAIHLADAYFEYPGPKPMDIFGRGCDLGRLALQKIVTWAVLDMKHFLFFIGPEAQVLRRLEEQAGK
jgi:hypothetical protein